MAAVQRFAKIENSYFPSSFKITVIQKLKTLENSYFPSSQS